MSTISLYDDPELDFDVSDDYVVIKDENSEVCYYYTEPSIIVSTEKTEIKLPTNDVEVMMQSNVVSKLIKASSVLSAPDLVFYNKNNSIFVGVSDRDNPTSNKLNINLGDDPTNGDIDYNFIIKIENLKLLTGDYRITLCEKMISKFESDKIVYYVAMDANSTFEVV